MNTLTARLRASVNFRRRLLNLSSSAQLPDETLGACNSDDHATILFSRNMLEVSDVVFLLQQADASYEVAASAIHAMEHESLWKLHESS